MKISNITTEQGMEIMCEIVRYVQNILCDEELLAELRRSAGADATREEAAEVGLSKLRNIANVILKKRREDVFGILAAINGKTVEEIAEQNVLVTAEQVRDIVEDKELIDFINGLLNDEVAA